MSSVLTKEYSFVRSLSQRIFGYWVLIFVSPLMHSRCTCTVDVEHCSLLQHTWPVDNTVAELMNGCMHLQPNTRKAASPSLILVKMMDRIESMCVAKGSSATEKANSAYRDKPEKQTVSAETRQAG